MAKKAGIALDQPNSNPGTTSRSSQCSGIKKRSILVSCGTLEEVADAVVPERDPVERRQRPECPLLDAEEEAPERRLPVGRVGVHGEEHAEVHVRVAVDVLALGVMLVVPRAPGTEAHAAQQGHGHLPPQVIHPTGPRQRVVAGVVPGEPHRQERHRGQRRQQQAARPPGQDHHREVRVRNSGIQKQQLARPETRRSEQTTLLEVLVQLAQELLMIRGRGDNHGKDCLRRPIMNHRVHRSGQEAVGRPYSECERASSSVRNVCVRYWSRMAWQTRPGTEDRPIRCGERLKDGYA